jgi:hypothetical protein
MNFKPLAESVRPGHLLNAETDEGRSYPVQVLEIVSDEDGTSARCRVRVRDFPGGNKVLIPVGTVPQPQPTEQPSAESKEP